MTDTPDADSERDHAGMWRTVMVSGVFEGFNLLGKFVLLVLISRQLSLADQGLLQILRNDLSIGMMLLGLEYANFTSREILRRPHEETCLLIRNQLLVHLITYLVLGPLLLTLFLLQDERLLPFAGLLGALLILDHLGQEMCRLLVTLKHAVASSVLFFLRHAVWIYVLLVLVLWRGTELTVAGICGWWIAGECVALTAGILLLRQIDWKLAWSTPIDWALMRHGLRVGAHFMLATVPAVLLSYGDILMLKSFGDVADEDLGVFSFYLQIRGAIISLCVVGVMSFFQPRIVGALQQGDVAGHRNHFRRALVVGTAAALFLAIVAGLLIYPLVEFLNRPVYLSHLGAYWLMLLMPAVYYVSSLLVMRLYAGNADRAIVVAAWAGLIATVACNLVLIPLWNLTGAALGTLLGLGTSIAVCSYCLRKS